jgi:hypothetical protein
MQTNIYVKCIHLVVQSLSLCRHDCFLLWWVNLSYPSQHKQLRLKVFCDVTMLYRAKVLQIFENYSPNDRASRHSRHDSLATLALEVYLAKEVYNTWLQCCYFVVLYQPSAEIRQSKWSQNLVGYDAVSIGNYLRMFRRNLLPPSSGYSKNSR